MIKFFRKIRQKLLSQNRFTRYLIYANGEIFLVVIGILIALQINTWNENRKYRNQEDEFEKVLTSMTLITEFVKGSFEPVMATIPSIHMSIYSYGNF